MIAIDNNGNLVIEDGKLSNTSNLPLQSFKAECRCVQGSYDLDSLYGRNPIVWELSKSVDDRIADLYRIGYKYLVVNSIVYQNGVYVIQ